MEFVEFPKIARLSRDIIITEKIDGTNAQILITEDGEIRFGSRTRWVTPENDNFGFAKWGVENAEKLIKLGPGRHFGEWWGKGIQRGYGLDGRRFSLFNASRWGANIPPECFQVGVRAVPILYTGAFSIECVEDSLEYLKSIGSQASPGFMKPEGIVVFHTASGHLYKKTIERDEEPKSKRA